ncbi:MAG: hypothetical protein AAGC46_21260 [Solirubrobacteraceae bacterium]
MNFKRLAFQAKKEFDKRGGAETVKDLQAKAKQAIDDRGGVEGIKASAKNVADAAKGPGTASDKAKAAAAAAKTEFKQPPAGGPADVVEGKKAS